MAYEIDSLPGLIELGNLNELGVSLIEFDVTDWLTDYPLGTFNITYIRPGETDVYPVDVTGVSEAAPESGNLELDVTRTELGALTEAVLMWTVSDAVTAIAGSGSAVVELAEGGTIKKRSDKVQTIVMDGHAAAGDPPEPLADYIEKWSAVDIEVTGLETGANPTGAVSQDADGTHFALGIPDGATGATGPQGIQGPTGPQGAQGAAGYTPQRTTDYWTAADVAVIESDVDDSIQDALADYVAVSDVADAFACDIASKKAINFAFTIADTDTKVITFSNIPTGRCEVFLEITASATAAVTWTLNSGSTLAWSTGSAPTLETGKIYRILFFTSDGGTNWDAFASVGV